MSLAGLLWLTGSFGFSQWFTVRATIAVTRTDVSKKIFVSSKILFSGGLHDAASQPL